MHKVGGVDILALLKFDKKIGREISHFNSNL